MKIVLLLSLLLSSLASHGDAYICNLDYHENLRDNNSTMLGTVILGIGESYEEKIGNFSVLISCHESIQISVQTNKISTEIIEPKDYQKKFFKSYISSKDRSGLRITCQQRILKEVRGSL